MQKAPIRGQNALPQDGGVNHGLKGKEAVHRGFLNFTNTSNFCNIWEYLPHLFVTVRLYWGEP